ncbi:MAG TPA: pyridoxamine 5'-phosphate oxidase family protein [Actinomycetota bacterium]|jgi:hypothetical protein
MLATLRSDGSPRISPMEPMILEGALILVGMPNTSKFRDLARDPRFCLHTATIDPHLADGDAKLWGEVVNRQDEALHERFVDHLVGIGGPDLRGQAIDPFYVGDIASASSIEIAGGKLQVISWKAGGDERVTSIS